MDMQTIINNYHFVDLILQTYFDRFHCTLEFINLLYLLIILVIKTELVPRPKKEIVIRYFFDLVDLTILQFISEQLILNVLYFGTTFDQI